MIILWSQLAQAPSPQLFGRSSHAITSINQSIFVFGGEHEPRVPFDSNLYEYNVQEKQWKTYPFQASFQQEEILLVAHTMSACSNTIYLFGGRNSQSIDMDTLFSFDLSTEKWAKITAKSSAPWPSSRSYHAMTTNTADKIFIFGGCHGKQRLNDLWEFNINTQEWSCLFDGNNAKENTIVPCVRGGSALAYANGKLYLHGGYTGKELDDFYSFDLQTLEWSSITSSNNPEPRSVHIMCPVLLQEHKYLFVYGGEGQPSAQGHLGAGKYFSNGFLFDLENQKWIPISQSENSSEKPSARGWIAAASIQNSVYLMGGFDGTSRLNDMYQLNISS